MADYYPLIARAVANLGPSDADDRRALYERATGALLNQLRNSDPPISEADITRERLALEDAIRRVEMEVEGSLPALPDDLPPPVVMPRAAALPPRDQPAGYDQAAPVERPRPPMPQAERGDRNWLRATVVAIAIAVVVALTATAAFMLRHDASEFAAARPAADTGGDTQQKAQDRLPGEAVTAEAPAQPAQPTRRPETAPAVGGSPTLAVLQRALLVEEAAEGSQELKQTVGKVLWRLDSVAVGGGEPPDVGVRVDLDLTDAGLKADVLLRRNRDAALPASHTIELRFLSPGRAGDPVRDVGVPEMRPEETVRGTPLVGIAVPVTGNVFLIGLSSLPSDVTRNSDLLKQRNWFMLPIRYASGKRALLLFEKGATGERAITDAFNAWQR